MLQILCYTITFSQSQLSTHSNNLSTLKKNQKTALPDHKPIGGRAANTHSSPYVMVSAPLALYVIPIWTPNKTTVTDGFSAQSISQHRSHSASVRKHRGEDFARCCATCHSRMSLHTVYYI